jgi:hypothetical protein
MKHSQLINYYFLQIILFYSFFSIITFNIMLTSGKKNENKQKTKKVQKNNLFIKSNKSKNKISRINRPRNNFNKFKRKKPIKLNKNNQKTLSNVNNLINNNINDLIEKIKQFKKNQENELAKINDENEKKQKIESQKKDYDIFITEQTKKINESIIENVILIISHLKQNNKIPKNFQENYKNSFLSQHDMQKIQMAETFIKNIKQAIQLSGIDIKPNILNEENIEIFKNIHNNYVNQKGTNYQIDEKNLNKINNLYF